MSNNSFIDNILNEINFRLNATTISLCVFSSLSFVLNIIIILDISKLKKENYKIKNLNYEIKKQNEKILLKLSLLSDTVFNNHTLISNDINLQRSNMLEIIDKTEILIYYFNKFYKKINNNKISNEKNKNNTNKNNTNKKNENEENENEEDNNKEENDDTELLNECYDTMPCNNINKITSTTAKSFFKIF